MELKNKILITISDNPQTIKRAIKYLQLRSSIILDVMQTPQTLLLITI